LTRENSASAILQPDQHVVVQSQVESTNHLLALPALEDGLLDEVRNLLD